MGNLLHKFGKYDTPKYVLAHEHMVLGRNMISN